MAEAEVWDYGSFCRLCSVDSAVMEVTAGAVRSGEAALAEVSEVSAAEWAGDSVAAAQAEDGRIK